MIVLQPALEVDPETVDFGYIDQMHPETRTLTLINVGTGDLAWNAQTSAEWLEIAPVSGVCSEGETSEVKLTAYGLALEETGEAIRGTLVLNSDGGRVKVPLRVGVASPQLDVDTTYLLLDPSVNRQPTSGAFRIFNRGLGLLTGTLRASEPWLVPDRASFECPTGRSLEVRVTTDMEEFPEGVEQAEATLTLESNGGDTTIQVAVEVVLAPNLQSGDEFVVLSRAEEGEALQGRLTIKNVGQAVAHAELRTSVPQIALSRNLCDIKPDKSVRVRVEWRGTLPEREGAEPHIDIVSGHQQIRVPVILEP
jgi:hypothetical protein